MDKRSFLHCLAGGFAASAWPALARAVPAADGAGAPVLIAAWRSSQTIDRAGRITGSGTPTDYVGLLAPDWETGRIDIRQALPVPARVHGLVAAPGGGYFAVAYRPGAWLLRIDAEGKLAVRRNLADEGPRTLDGHAVLTPDGEALITTETDPETSAGWISVRDPRTLERLAEWRTHGPEPHEARFDPGGHLLVANGGILRGANDRKRDLERMDSSLVRLDIASGVRLGQWRLRDPRLSLRHLAVGHAPASGGPPLVGVALQAEHDDATRRAAAPILAIWDGERLDIPSHMPLGAGYCGDIAAAPDGGFYLSSERAGRTLRWHPGRPGELTAIAELERAGALAPWLPDAAPGVLIAAARGLARWHPVAAPRFLRWPVEMAPDNHWTVPRA